MATSSHRRKYCARRWKECRREEFSSTCHCCSVSRTSHRGSGLVSKTDSSISLIDTDMPDRCHLQQGPPQTL
jgi:hypothetical protein